MSQYHSERSTRYGRRGAIARQVRHMLTQREGGKCFVASCWHDGWTRGADKKEGKSRVMFMEQKIKMGPPRPPCHPLPAGHREYRSHGREYRTVLVVLAGAPPHGEYG